MDAGVVVTVKTIERFWQMALKNAKDYDKPAEPAQYYRTSYVYIEVVSAFQHNVKANIYNHF